MFLLDFIKQQPLATISTISGDMKPQAAVIGFGQTENLEIIFGTDSSSRKYKSLKTNPSVALVIGWVGSKTVQYEGIASELTSNDLHLVRENYWSKNPDAEKHHKNEGERYFIVKPNWIRYTDLSKEPWEIIALEF